MHVQDAPDKPKEPSVVASTTVEEAKVVGEDGEEVKQALSDF